MSLTAKASIRQHYRYLRHQLSAEEKKAASEKIAILFLNHFFCQNKKIAVYLARDSEINLQPLIEKL